VQPPQALVRETPLGSQLLSLLRVVSQRQPLGESAPIQKKTTSAPPLPRASKCHPWTSPGVSLAETSVIRLLVGSAGRRFTHLRRSSLAHRHRRLRRAAAAARKNDPRAPSNCLFRRHGARRRLLKLSSGPPRHPNTFMSIRGRPSAILRRGCCCG
jgi:hypothetical protein